MSDLVYKSSDGWMLMYLLFPPLSGSFFSIGAFLLWHKGVGLPMATIVAGIGLWDLLFTVRAWNKWSGVSLDMHGLQLHRAGPTRQCRWDQVKSCTPVRWLPMFAWLPGQLYQLRLAHPDQLIYFVPGPSTTPSESLSEPDTESMIDVIHRESARERRDGNHAI